MTLLSLLKISSLLYIACLLVFIVYRFRSKKGMSDTLWSGALLSLLVSPVMIPILFVVAYFEVARRSKSLLRLYARKAKVSDSGFFDLYGVFLANPLRYWPYLLVTGLLVGLLVPAYWWVLALSLFLWFLVYLFVNLLFIYKHMSK